MNSRRKFIKSFVRGGLLTTLGATTGYLLLRDKSDGQNCDYDFVCRNCKKIKSCDLPEAKRFNK